MKIESLGTNGRHGDVTWEQELVKRRKWYIRGVNGVFVKCGVSEYSTKRSTEKKRNPHLREAPLYRRMSRWEKRKRKRMHQQYDKTDMRWWDCTPPSINWGPGVYAGYEKCNGGELHFDRHDVDSEDEECVACVGEDIPGYSSESDSPYESSSDSVQSWSSAEVSSYVDSDGETWLAGTHISRMRYNSPDHYESMPSSPYSSLHSSDVESIDVEDYDSENDVVLWTNGVRTYGSVVVDERGVTSVTHDDQLELSVEELSFARLRHRRHMRLIMAEMLMEVEYRWAMLQLNSLALFQDPESSIGYENFFRYVRNDPLPEVVAAFAEQLLLLLYTCHNCRDITGIAAAVSGWVLTKFMGNKACSMSGYKMLAQFIGTRYDGEELPSNFDLFHEVATAQEAESCAGVIEGFSNITEESGGFTNCESVMRIKTLLSSLSAIGLCSLFGFEFSFEACGTTLAKLDTILFKVSLVETIMENIKYFCKSAWVAYETGDVYALLGRNEVTEYSTRITAVADVVERITGSLQVLTVELRIALCEELKELEHIGAKLLRTKAKGGAIPWFQNQYNQIISLKTAMSKLATVGKSRPPAYAILVYGPTGVGKSSFCETLSVGLLNAHTPNSATAQSIMVQVGQDKYDQVAAGKSILCMEELSSANPDKAMDPTNVIHQIQRNINTAGVQGVFAALENKGMPLQAFKLVTATTNVKDFFVSSLASQPVAALRRFKTYITLNVKPEYKTRGTLDESKVPRGVAPWLITLEDVCVHNDPDEAVQSAHYTHKKDRYSFSPVIIMDGDTEVPMINVEWDVAFKVLSERYNKHANAEKQWIRDEHCFLRMGICIHKTPYNYCPHEECIAKRVNACADYAGEVEEAEQLPRFIAAKIPKLSVSCSGLCMAERFAKTIDKIGITEFPSDIVQEYFKFRHEYKASVEVVEAVKILARWHKDNAHFQDTKYFEAHEKGQLLAKWVLLDKTSFLRVRAPWMSVGYNVEEYFPCEFDSLYEAINTSDRASFSIAQDNFMFKQISAEYAVLERKHPWYTWCADKYVNYCPWVHNLLMRWTSTITPGSSRGVWQMFTATCASYAGVLSISWIYMTVWQALAFIFGTTSLLTFGCWIVSAYLRYGCYVRVLTRDPQLRFLQMAMRAHQMRRHKYVKIVAGVGALMAASIVLKQIFSSKKKTAESCGSTMSRPVEIRPNFHDAYQVAVSDFSRFTKTRNTNTVEQALSVIDKHLLVIRFSKPCMGLDGGLNSFQNCIHTGMCVLVNAHPFNNLGEKEWMEIEVYRDVEMGPRRRIRITRNEIEPFGNDLVAVLVEGLQPARDLLSPGNSLFPEINPKKSVDCTWVYRTGECMLQHQRVIIRPTSVSYHDVASGIRYNYEGCTFKVDEAKKGQCMAVLVGHVGPATVLAVHVAGIIGTREARGTVLLRPEAEAAISALQDRCVLPIASVGELDVDPYNIGLYLDDITKDTAVNFLPKGPPVSAVVHGQVPGLIPRSVRMGDAQYTSIGKKVEERFPEYAVSVPVNLHRNGFIVPLRQASTSSTMIDPFVMRKAKEEVKAFVKHRIAEAEKVGGVSLFDAVHPIPIDSVLNDAVSGFNVPDLSKSAGYGLPGKKRNYVSVDGDEHKTLDPRVVARVNLIFDRAKNRIMSQTIHSGSLKKELLPTSKCRPPGNPKVVYTLPVKDGEIFIEDLLEYKVRFFAGCSFEYLIACKMMFGMLLRFFTLHSIIFGMAFGINPHSYDFTAMTKRWLKFEKHILAGDYKKFDKKLDSTVTRGGAEIILYILQLAGYDEEQLLICGMLLMEVIFPTYLWAGVVLTLSQSSPSGHPLTAFKNNFDNRLALTYCWYRIMGVDGPSFNDNVELNMMGDDHIGTVFTSFVKYNCMTIAAIMTKEVGIEYTTADKRTMDVLYENFDTVEYLKMRAVWDDELQVYKPQLNKASIYKMITKTLAEYTPDSPEMDEHTLLVCQDAMVHMYYYGEAEYVEFVNMLEECFVGVKHRSLIAPSYNMQNEAYKKRLAESNSVIHDTDFVKPLSWLEEPSFETEDECWYVHGEHMSVRSKCALTV